MVCFAQMIGQDVCVSCTYAVLLGDKSTQNRRGNAMGSRAGYQFAVPKAAGSLLLTRL